MVDPVGMRSLGMWLLVIAGVTLGFQIASPTSGTPRLVAAGIVLFVGSSAVALGIASRRGKGCHLWFAAALGLLAVARGASAPLPIEVEADRRGAPAPTRALRIEGASIPGPGCRVSARTARAGASGGSAVELRLPADMCPLWWGQEIRVPSGDLHTDSARRTPESFAAVAVSRAWLGPSPQLSWSSRLRSNASEALARARQAGWDAAHGDADRGFVVASSLGLSHALPPDSRAQLRRAGLGHLVAVSGLHVGLAAIVWLGLLRWMFARRWWGARAAVALALLPVAAYVVLTGAAAPAVRAAFMFGLVGLGSVLGRPTHRLSVLAVAVALMLFVDPQWVAQPGFQLSVAAMVVLVSLPSGAGASLTSWQLGWALLPLLWLHFDASSDGSVLANAVAVPIFALWVVPLAIAGWGLVPLVGGVALDPAAMGAGLILDVAQVVASWPEIPRVVWVAGAVLSWVPRVRRSMSESGRAWLPHRGAAALLLVVAVVSWWPASVHPAWTAWSRGRSPEVLAVAPDGTGCVRNPVSAAPLWRTRFDAHGVRTLSGVQLSSRASVADPAVLAWLEGLGGRARNTTRGAPSCSLPSDDLVRRSLDLCRAFSSAPSARLPAGQSLQCWSARLGEWQPAPIHSR